MWDSPPNIFWCQNFGTELETQKIKYSGLEIPASNGENLKIPFPEQEVTRMENFTLYHFAWNVLFFSRMNAPTHTRTWTHAHPHTRTHLLAHKGTHTCTLSLSHILRQTQTKSHSQKIFTLSLSNLYVHTHTYLHTHTHTILHTPTHTYTCTHRHSHTLHSVIFFPDFFHRLRRRQIVILSNSQYFLWSHTVITENAEHRTFDVHNIENIRPKVRCIVHRALLNIENITSNLSKLVRFKRAGPASASNQRTKKCSQPTRVPYQHG